MGDYYHAIPWLEEAVSLFRGSYGEWKTEDEASLEDALDHLAFAYFQVGELVRLTSIITINIVLYICWTIFYTFSCLSIYFIFPTGPNVSQAGQLFY